ncbi:hypothetical protein IWQ62_001065 [Dispira parvispora]|uniref:Uncharacterized protein n=1 Tax=Dispira parvispora TaxID=1520584 RepID=A0A9W8AWZ6_9FUNG|nr:hypothetical protein IWQ62_001065 [Dispira parvispora]
MSYTTLSGQNTNNDPTVPVYSAGVLWTGLAILLAIWLAKDYRVDWRQTLGRSPQTWSNRQSNQASLQTPLWVYIPLAPFAGVYLFGRLFWELFRIAVFTILDGVIVMAQTLVRCFYHTLVPLTIWFYRVGLGQILRIWAMDFVERSAIWLYDVGFPTLASACTTLWQVNQRVLTNTRDQLVYFLQRLFHISYTLYHRGIIPLVRASQILGRGLLHVGHRILALVRILIYCSRIVGQTLVHDLVAFYTCLVRTGHSVIRAVHGMIYHAGLVTLGQHLILGLVLIGCYLVRVKDRIFVTISMGYQNWVIPTLRRTLIYFSILTSRVGNALRYWAILVYQMSRVCFVVLNRYVLHGWQCMARWSELAKQWVSRHHFIWVVLQRWCRRGQTFMLQGWHFYQSGCLWVVQRFLGPMVHFVVAPALTWLTLLLRHWITLIESFGVKLGCSMRWIFYQFSFGLRYGSILLTMTIPYVNHLLQVLAITGDRLVTALLVFWKRIFLPILVHGCRSISTLLITLAQGVWTVSCIIWSMVEPFIPTFQQHVSQTLDEVTLWISHGMLDWAKNFQYQQHDSE